MNSGGNGSAGWQGGRDGNGGGRESSNVQEQLYKMLERLKAMAREVPPKYQPRLNYELLSSLAALLLDDTVMQIVAELTEMQHINECCLHQSRTSLLNSHRVERERQASNHKIILQTAKCSGRNHAIPQLMSSQQQQQEQLAARHAGEIKHCNENILRAIDQKVMEQQSTLQQVGVPSFFVTSSPLDVKVQMYVLKFITRLGNNTAGMGYP